MKLYIAEKPSLGRAIASVLPKPHKNEDGYIRVGNGDCVSWCIGHLLEQAEPDAYDPAYKQWKLEHLPIIPEQWQLQPKPKTRKQLTALKKLIKQADQIVHAGDPDREGQLLVDQVIDHVGVPDKKRQSIQRCLINDLNPTAVSRALNQLRWNKEFIPLATSALARSRADWLYGINMTRAYTVQGRKVGFDGLLSVGRVQTPLLGLVVQRDVTIANFVSKSFYQVKAHLIDNDKSRNVNFSALWKPSEACQPHMDEEGRVLNKALAENVVKRVTNKAATVTKVEKKKKSQAAPLPYNLSALQIDAAKRFSMSAKQVLDTCQSLYEKHKLITYPRSDCRYLPVEQLANVPSVFDATHNNCEKLQDAIAHADRSRKSKAWNDSKVSAHHAIVPTAKKSDSSRLSKPEQNIYELIARQYIAQFYPTHEYEDTTVELIIAGGNFIAKAKRILTPGWKTLYPAAKKNNADKEDKEAQEDIQQQLPALKKGDSLHCRTGELVEKLTQPPKHFTDATLLAAMTGIARFVQNKELLKILKETDGLGTEATRAGIIELLFNRSFLKREGKNIRATEAGKGLIQALPDAATQPDMTAHWETQLNAISQREASYTNFMTPMLESLNTLIEESKVSLPTSLEGIKSAKPSFKKKGSYKRRKSTSGTKASGASKKKTSAKRKIA